MDIEYINKGSGLNAGDGDSLDVVANKLNKNFDVISSRLRLRSRLRHIIWKSLADTERAVEDINYNFSLIDELLK